MIFLFLNFSQCLVCIKRSTKLQISKSTPIFCLKNSLHFNYNEPLIWTTKLLSFICDITNCKSYWNSTGWLAGRTLGWAPHVSKSKPSADVFKSLYFWWKPNVFRKFGCHFNLILHIMSDEAAFVSELCFVYSVTGETSISPAQTAPPAGR